MTKPRTIVDYNSMVTSVSMSVLLEVMTILKTYKESLVLIGGWVPYLLLRDNQLPEGTFGGSFFDRAVFAPAFQHAGSIDIDLAVDVSKIGPETYSTIVQRLTDRGYTLDSINHFRLNRAVAGMGAPIGIDFLVERAPGQGKARRHRTVQHDLQARVTPHLDVAFKHFAAIQIEGNLPDGGGKTSLVIRVTDIPAFFALKGLALGERYKEKDAYDLYAVTRYYGLGFQKVASALRPFHAEPGLKEGLINIRQKFRNLEAEGPAWVVKFISPASDEEVARLRQDAFMTMNALLEKLAQNG